MEEKNASPLFARIMLGVSALIAVGVVYWFLSSALAAIPLPILGPARSAKSFNPKADVAKNPVFGQLDQNYLSGVPDLPAGRDNPFIPANSAADSTTTQIIPPEGLLVPGTSVRTVPVELPPVENSTGTSAINADAAPTLESATTTEL
ncbi:MAG: hypothetical protein WCT54_03865 [Patescibacteria group bacterium]